jgi:hypothetical protein
MLALLEPKHVNHHVGGYDDYETVKVPERKTVTFGVDLAKLEGGC